MQIQNELILFENYTAKKTKPIIMKSYTIQEINEVLQGTIVGSTDTIITAPEQLDAASDTEISFIGHRKYEKIGQLLKLVLP